MANLLDLMYITGQKSISDMTDSELLEHLKMIRSSRRQTKPYDAKTTERRAKPKPDDELSRVMRMLKPD